MKLRTVGRKGYLVMTTVFVPTGGDPKLSTKFKGSYRLTTHLADHCFDLMDISCAMNEERGDPTKPIPNFPASDSPPWNIRQELKEESRDPSSSDPTDSTMFTATVSESTPAQTISQSTPAPSATSPYVFRLPYILQPRRVTSLELLLHIQSSCKSQHATPTVTPTYPMVCD